MEDNVAGQQDPAKRKNADSTYYFVVHRKLKNYDDHTNIVIVWVTRSSRGLSTPISCRAISVLTGLLVHLCFVYW
jgi:hypothetical protein